MSGLNKITWDDVQSIVSMDDESKHDHYLDVRQIWYEDGKLRLPFGVGEKNWNWVELSPHAKAQLIARAELPAAYLAKLRARESDLEDLIIHEGLHRLGEDEATRTIFLRMKGHVVHAIFSEKYSVISNSDVVSTLIDITDRSLCSVSVNEFSLNVNGLWMKLVNEDLDIVDPTQTGYNLFPGVVIGNSEIGIRPISIWPFSFREWCMNTAVSADKGGTRRHIHFEPDSLERDFRRGIARGMRAAMKRMKKSLGTRDIKLRKPGSAIKALCKKNKLSKDVMTGIVRSFKKDPDRSAWGVVQALTRTARDMSGDSQIQLQSVAGDLFDQNEKFWHKLAA
jgi:hypothetical protein